MITEIPDVLWYAVLVGAAINMLLFVMLRMPLLQQFLLGTISAFFLGVILFVIVALDDPLRGESGLDPEPLQLLWDRTMVWDEPLDMRASDGRFHHPRSRGDAAGPHRHPRRDGARAARARCRTCAARSP